MHVRESNLYLQEHGLYNTYSLILLSDGSTLYAVLRYGRINWGVIEDELNPMVSNFFYWKILIWGRPVAVMYSLPAPNMCFGYNTFASFNIILLTHLT